VNDEYRRNQKTNKTTILYAQLGDIIVEELKGLFVVIPQDKFLELFDMPKEDIQEGDK